MKQRKDRINALSVVALVLVGLGGCLAFSVVNSCTSECYGMLVFLLPPIGLTLIGALIGLVSWSIAVRAAVVHGDRVSALLLILCLALSIGAMVYLGGAALVRAGAPLTPSNGLLSFIPPGWNTVVYAAPAVFALFYRRFRDSRAPRLSALGACSAVLLFVPLIVAPPWSAFNPADRPPVFESTGPVSAADCVRGMYPPIIVRNVGGSTLRWTATINMLPATFSPHGVAIRPSNGSIGPGGSQNVMLVGDFLPTSDTQQGVSLEFDSNGGAGGSYMNCQVPSGQFRVTPSSITTTCRDIALPLITVANTGQNDALWTLTTTELGLNISPQRGSLHPGQSQAVAVLGNVGPPGFSLLFNGGPRPLTVTVTVTCT